MMYWRFLLSLSGVVLVVVFVYGGWQLFSVMYDEPVVSAGVTDEAQRSSFNVARIDTVLQKFSARTAAFESQKSRVPSVADPGQ